MCPFADAKAIESYATLSVYLPSKENDIYSLGKGKLKLCYHGNYKVDSNKGAVAFKKCSAPFNVVEAKKKPVASTGYAVRWVSSTVIAIVGFVFVSYF